MGQCISLFQKMPEVKKKYEKINKWSSNHMYRLFEKSNIFCQSLVVLRCILSVLRILSFSWLLNNMRTLEHIHFIRYFWSKLKK